MKTLKRENRVSGSTLRKVEKIAAIRRRDRESWKRHLAALNWRLR